MVRILWREEVSAHENEYSNVELSHMHADNCAMQLVRNPKQFDVIVTDNLFGDILSDEVYAHRLLECYPLLLWVQSIGIISESLKYEPVHGSAFGYSW